jgi:hypothetical protein
VIRWQSREIRPERGKVGIRVGEVAVFRAIIDRAAQYVGCFSKEVTYLCVSQKIIWNEI